ncbi:hypothetical protein GCM10018785_69180 [Streptomyces longispororuber]|uniref:Uncharacterized protein n=1 Tax=Streptomyces longispororuber TaxID=68230 RepID=A0A919DZ07_9ACTN|nr:hypothetical protein GCM10018785_69180 [Streptomyces longispororuber]
MRGEDLAVEDQARPWRGQHDEKVIGEYTVHKRVPEQRTAAAPRRNLREDRAMAVSRAQTPARNSR